ncbi:MAG: aminotransferase class V-fold PLP-dependent enzyme [Betaproteobacteria bacterium]
MNPSYRLINAAGPLTPLGAGLVPGQVAAEIALILAQPADMAALQALASDEIRRAFDAEAGCVTGCTAAGIAIAAAAAMTGSEVEKIEQLPDTAGMNDEIALPGGHDVWFGAKVGQMIRLSGAKLVAEPGPNTAAGVYVSSHHVHSGPSLGDFISKCKGVPVIVDAAGSVDIAPFLRAGAALVLASAQKNFCGPTAGIVAGRRHLVAACLAQERGIGRAMRAGKENVAGVIAGLRAWRERKASLEMAWRRRAERLCALLGGTLEMDEPERRIPRARIVARRARRVSETLRGLEPPIRVWEAGVERGYFELDPRCLRDEEVEPLAKQVKWAIERATTP